eukprot:gene49667-60800_t
MLNYAIVAGSSRANSQSGKVARFIRQRLVELQLANEAHTSVIDLGAQPLPLWPAEDTGPWAGFQQQLKAADAVIVIAPEWNGMACPAIKNFFIYASKAELAQKPGLLVGISSGATLAAIAQKLPELPAGAKVLGFNYDTGERYLSVEAQSHGQPSYSGGARRPEQSVFAPAHLCGDFAGAPPN